MASEVDIDRSVATEEIYSLSANTPYDCHLQGETIFTKGELDKITTSLQEIIAESKVTTSVDFGREQRIDPMLLRKVVERLNIKTSNDPNIIILDDLIISEPELAASKQKFFALLNQATAPLIVVEIDLDDSLFKHALVKPIIIKSLPKAIKEGVVEGTLEKDQFIPKTYTLQLQKTQLNALEKNGVVDIANFSKVGIRNVEEYLKENLSSEFTVLEKYVILNSYVDDIIAEVEETLSKDSFVDLSAVTMLGVATESADRLTISKTYLPQVLEKINVPVESVYLQEVDKKTKKTMLPNYIVTASLEKEILDTLESNLVIPSAISDALQASNDENLSLFIEDEETLGSEVLSKLPKFDNKRISAFISKEFSRQDLDAKPVPSQLLRYYAAQFGVKLKELYDATWAGEVHRLYDAAKLDNLVLLLINLRGILDLVSTDKKLAAKIYGILTESIANQSSPQYRYVSKDAANLEMTELESFFIEQIKAIQPPDFNLADALSKRQQRIIEGLERALSHVKDVTEAAYVLQLATIIVHSKVLAHDHQYGSLNITGKYTPKVLKSLEKKVDVNELRSLIDAIRSGEVTDELISQAKSLAIDM